MIILFDHRLFHRKRKSLAQRIEKTQAAFDELSAKLNTYRLKNEAAIDKACQAILKKYKTRNFFEYTLHKDPLVTYKNQVRDKGLDDFMPNRNDYRKPNICFKNSSTWSVGMSAFPTGTIMALCRN